MIKTLIVEDELYIRKGLTSMLAEIENDMDIIGECESLNDAVVVAKACKPDLVLLDINIIGGTGFDFIEQTKDLNYQIIFITAYEEYALKAIKNGALDYILKPVDKDELVVALNKISTSNPNPEQLSIANDHFNGTKEKLVLRLQEGLQIIPFDELKFCKSEGTYTYFYMEDDRHFIASKSIKEFESQLPSENFYRTHQSFIVNTNFVDKYDKRGFVKLKCGTRVDVSVRKKDGFIQMLTK